MSTYNKTRGAQALKSKKEVIKIDENPDESDSQVEATPSTAKKPLMEFEQAFDVSTKAGFQELLRF
jgi:hypothetical protein